MIYIANKKRKLESIKAEFPTAIILDITSTSPLHSGQILSPFYPHGSIPIPFTEGITATCVEAVWQGLKVFEHHGVEFRTFKNATQKDVKRTIRKYGKMLGHAKGVKSKDLLNYFDARMQIYLPTYKWVLDNIPEVKHVITRIKEQSIKNDIVLLDYNTNIEFRDITKPISHAGLVKLYIEGNYPNSNDFFTPLTKDESIVRDKILKSESRKRKKEAKTLGQSQLTLK